MVVVCCFLSCLCLTLVSCFRGARRSVMTFCCVFVASRLRARVERWVSFGQLPGRIFCVFFLPGPFFGAFGGPLCCFLALWIHKVTHLCQLAPPDLQLDGRLGHQVDFPPPLWSVLGALFVTFSYFKELCDFVRFELPSRPERDFECPRSLKILLFLFWSLSNFRR